MAQRREAGPDPERFRSLGNSRRRAWESLTSAHRAPGLPNRIPVFVNKTIFQLPPETRERNLAVSLYRFRDDLSVSGAGWGCGTPRAAGAHESADLQQSGCQARRHPRRAVRDTHGPIGPRPHTGCWLSVSHFSQRGQGWITWSSFSGTPSKFRVICLRNSMSSRPTMYMPDVAGIHTPST